MHLWAFFFFANEKLIGTNVNGSCATQLLNKDLIDIVSQVSGTKWYNTFKVNVYTDPINEIRGKNLVALVNVIWYIGESLERKLFNKHYF